MLLFLKKTLLFLGYCLLWLWKLWAYSIGFIVLVAALYMGWQIQRLIDEWPNWQALASGPIPKSNFIAMAEANTRASEPLRWQPVPLSKISPYLRDAAVRAEDARFWQHHGVDWAAIGETLDKNINPEVFTTPLTVVTAETFNKLLKVKAGASTISQQTVKNLFLTGERTIKRKLLELLLTLDMERHLSKERILEIYLNIAQFGPRVYGAQAASHYYYNIRASELTAIQAAELAATLPDPVDQNPKRQTRLWERRRNNILWFMAGVFNPPKDQLPPQFPGDTSAESATADISDVANFDVFEALDLLPAEVTAETP